ncbi:MAG: tetratricopeptide repeat protein [Acidobacteriota bacterium]|nr:tetratricopeptide repeat protein [Acidobacteriota bacterium]
MTASQPVEPSASSSGPSNRWLTILAILSAAGVFAAYANHFHNSFHFDDGTVIQNNAYLRSLKNIPLFFRDASTFSSFPTNAAYRPLTSVSFALDYWRGAGLDPFAFHVTQWTLHLLLGVLVFFFVNQTLRDAGLARPSRWLALFGATLFCLHRANAETVNFLTLRSEILSTAGVVGSFVFYQYAPRWRKSLLWLLPAAAGAFAKQTAIVFAPLFLIYLLLFSKEAGGEIPPSPGKRWSWLRVAVPPFVFGAFFYFLQGRLGGPRLIYGSTPPLIYLQTQTFAWLHYFRLFLLPLGLSADPDWAAIPHWFDTRVFAGTLFALLFVGSAAFYASRRSAGRAFLFGALWFFVALAPTSSFFPRSEMINEHRPYFPYIGLVLCLTAAAGDLLCAREAPGRSPSRRRLIGAAAALGIVLLCAHAAATFARNRVWRNEETLWKSVTEASPGNGRAWMNYGLIFMARADYANARSCFERASTLAPNYDLVEVNLGVLEGASGRPADAERHFQRALSLNSNIAMANFYYGRWLHENNRDGDAAARLDAAIAASPADLDARHLLARVYEELGARDSVCSLARETLRIAAGDPESAAAVARSCLPR